MKHIKSLLILAILLACFGQLLTTDTLATDTFATDSSAIDSLEIYLSKGNKALFRGKLEEALLNYESAQILDPSNLDVVKSLGVIHSRLGHHSKALSFLKKAHQFDPSNANICNNLGAVYSNLGNHVKAVEYYKKSIAIDSADAITLNNLGREYAKLGQIEDALVNLHSALKLDTANSVIMFWLGNCFATAKQLDSARYYFEQSAEAGGRSAELYYFLGSVQRDLGDSESAISNFLIALERDPEHTFCLQSLGMLLFREKKYSEAVGYFKTATKTDSVFFPAWIGLGAASALCSDSVFADSVYEKLMTLDSNMALQMLNMIQKEE